MLSKCTTLNPHLSAMFMISIPKLCRGIARLNLILGHTFKTLYSSVTTGMLVHSYVRLLTVVVWKGLEIVIPPVALIWFLRNLKPRNYITILINTKSLKIFWLFMWTQHVFTFWLIIHTVMHTYIEHNYKYYRNNAKICSE